VMLLILFIDGYVFSLIVEEVGFLFGKIVDTQIIGLLYGGYAIGLLLALILDSMLYEILGGTMFLMIAAFPLLLGMGLALNYNRAAKWNTRESTDYEMMPLN